MEYSYLGHALVRPVTLWADGPRIYVHSFSMHAGAGGIVDELKQTRVFVAVSVLSSNGSHLVQGLDASRPQTRR